MKKITLITASILTAFSVNAAFFPAYAASPVQSSQQKTQTAGELFLEKNKKNPGVVVLADGLQYKIINKGKGPSPTDADIVTVDYVGNLVDGTEFDSSYKRGQPATFPVSAVIPGWTEALKLMNVGATWEVYIPAALAYGQEGSPPAIGPNQVLVFKIHLIEINKP